MKHNTFIMKKLFVFLVISLIGTGAFAQMGQMKMKNGVMMKNGKMMVMKNNKAMPMTSNMTMSNGTMVMTDGMVKMKNGKTMMLKNGECVYMDGKMSHMKMGNKMSTPMKKDSM